MSDTPETDKARFDVEFGQYGSLRRVEYECGDFVCESFARRLELERNEAREQAAQYAAEREHNAMQALAYKAERDKLVNAIRSFCTDFEAIRWGWDGDCGSARLADSLFESLKGVAP